jgi:hypothetical protein
MKDWHKLKPELFRKRPYYVPGCDTGTVAGPGTRPKWAVAAKVSELGVAATTRCGAPVFSRISTQLNVSVGAGLVSAKMKTAASVVPALIP